MTELALFEAGDNAETEDLRRRIKELSRELVAAQDRASRRERELRAWEERVVSSARRRYEDQVTSAAVAFLTPAVRRLRHPFDGLLYRIDQLGDRPKKADLAGLRSAADLARSSMAGFGEQQVSAWAQGQVAEVARLRGYIREVAERLHAESGALPAAPTWMGCACVGCELVSGMDAVGGHEAAPEPGADVVVAPRVVDVDVSGGVL